MTYNAPEASWKAGTISDVSYWFIWVNADKRALATRVAKWHGCMEYALSERQGKLVQIGLRVPYRRYRKACRVLGLEPCQEFIRMRAAQREAGALMAGKLAQIRPLRPSK